MSERRLALDDGSLVDVLDRLLDAGAYVDGTVLITLADVDLVRLDLRVLLASIETLRRDVSPPEAVERGRPAANPAPAIEDTRGQAGIGSKPHHKAGPSTTYTRASARAPTPYPRIHAGSEFRETGAAGSGTSAGIAGLVVAVVDILRKLLERQALRRMDAGSLTDDQVERLGRALMALEQQTSELATFVRGLQKYPSPPSAGRLPWQRPEPVVAETNAPQEGTMRERRDPP
ncbi:gas vesicle protein GvpJ [Actinopolymorpha alba]|uniref:gas vesicle protein GvpJ n=1 Tax=Actinopolymorpha alba TaxID=533267 RepID=UPI00037986D6|nr:gas vesicle protein GvpJ [Actinopolymorpha alba]